MYKGVTCSVLAQPWSCNHSNYSYNLLSKGNNTTMSHEHKENMKIAMESVKWEPNHRSIMGSHNSINDEDFFIEDLSDFSNEDIAAPIKSDHDSALQQDSDENSASTIKSDCTTTTTTTTITSSASDLLQDSAILDCKKSAYHHELKDSSLSLPCQDETGFEWLTSLGDDALIYGASNFGMDSFLLSNAEPFGDYDGMMKYGEYEDSIKVKDMNNISTNANSALEYEQGGQEDRLMWDDDVNGLRSCNVTLFAPPVTGSRSARSKRARSSGWSSSSILCDQWPESPSPTNSLNSTSQIIVPTPQFNNMSTPSFMCKGEEGYTTASHHDIEINVTSRLISNHQCDKPLCDLNVGSKFGTNEQWHPKEEDNCTREESLSNYGGGLQSSRRCTHCLSQKTPQWRAGPQGPKTLCNACGVRYKSGRLFDEYRPAKSPTFLSYKHSNSHKKVVEMRRRKSVPYNQQQQQHAVMHHVGSSPPTHADVGRNQHHFSKFKVKLNNPENSELPSTQFSDITLISTRNTIESPSSFLY